MVALTFQPVPQNYQILFGAPNKFIKINKKTWETRSIYKVTIKRL